jgi:hypothetical protein
MLGRRPARSRVVDTTLRRLDPLDLARAVEHALRPIGPPGLVVTIPDGRAGHRPNI